MGLACRRSHGHRDRRSNVDHEPRNFAFTLLYFADHIRDLAQWKDGRFRPFGVERLCMGHRRCWKDLFVIGGRLLEPGH